LISILNQKNSEIVPALVAKFHDSVIKDGNSEYEEILRRKLEIEFQEFLKICENKEKYKCQDFLKKNLNKIERRLRKGEIKSMKTFNKELNYFKNQFQEKYPHFDNTTSTNLWRGSTEKLIFKAGDYISKIIADKAKEESMILKAQLSSMQASYERLSSELEQEKTRKFKDIREIEKKNATLKSTINIIEEKFVMTENSQEEKINTFRSQMSENEVNSTKDL